MQWKSQRQNMYGNLVNIQCNIQWKQEKPKATPSSTIRARSSNQILRTLLQVYVYKNMIFIIIMNTFWTRIQVLMLCLITWNKLKPRIAFVLVKIMHWFLKLWCVHWNIQNDVSAKWICELVQQLQCLNTKTGKKYISSN